MEGDDDMPGHVKSSLMGPSLNIPVSSACVEKSRKFTNENTKGEFFFSRCLNLFHRYVMADWALGPGKEFI